MNKLWLLILYVALPCCVLAQQRTEYNRRGDDAMKRLDYSDAKMWYEEGISTCDTYSINQLTTIWLANEQMRSSMRSLMNKCLNCLNVLATENDTTAVSKLITYYTEGIGTPRSDELATYWTERLDELRRPAEPIYSQITPIVPVTPRERMKFFVGYAFSMQAPYGLTVGGVANHLGWYVRFKSNFSTDKASGECTNEAVIGAPADVYYNFTGKKRINSYMGFGGLIIKCTPWLYTSVGVGYGMRELQWQYVSMNHADDQKRDEVWCKNTQASYDGVTAEVDVMVKLGSFFLSVGCNTMNFKYVDLNAGAGIFF